MKLRSSTKYNSLFTNTFCDEIFFSFSYILLNFFNNEFIVFVDWLFQIALYIAQIISFYDNFNKYLKLFVGVLYFVKSF